MTSASSGARAGSSVTAMRGAVPPLASADPRTSTHRPDRARARTVAAAAASVRPDSISRARSATAVTTRGSRRPVALSSSSQAVAASSAISMPSSSSSTSRPRSLSPPSAERSCSSLTRCASAHSPLSEASTFTSRAVKRGAPCRRYSTNPPRRPESPTSTTRSSSPTPRGRGGSRCHGHRPLPVVASLRRAARRPEAPSSLYLSISAVSSSISARCKPASSIWIVDPLVDGQCRCRVEPDRGRGVERHGAAQHAHRSTSVLVNGQTSMCETDELAVDSVRRQRGHPTSPPWGSGHGGAAVPVRPFPSKMHRAAETFRRRRRCVSFSTRS